MNFSKNILEKIFNSYNEITKYFEVKVVMNKDKSYSLKLTPKNGNGGKGKSKLDFLIEQFMLFKADQDKRWAEQDKRWAEQDKHWTEQQKFNQFVLEQLKKHDELIKTICQKLDLTFNLFKKHGWTK